MDIKYFNFVSEPKSLDECDLPDSAIGLVDIDDVRALVEGYRNHKHYSFSSYLEDKIYEWIESAPVEEGGEDLIPRLFNHGTIVHDLLWGDVEASISESGNDLLVGVLRSMLEGGCDGWIDTKKWTESASQAVKSFLDYLMDGPEKNSWDLPLYYAIESYVEHCESAGFGTALRKALDRALFIEWKESPGQIWSVNGHIIADSLFCRVDDEGNVWSYHDGFYFVEDYQKETEYLVSRGVVIWDDPGWRLNGVSVSETDVPIPIRKECPYCDFVLRKGWAFAGDDGDDDEYCELDFDSSLEDRPCLD